MEQLEIVIVLLAVVTALAEVTDRIKIPHPILLVLAGIGIGVFPGLPRVELEPEVVFLIFLPPILYAAAFSTSWPDFRAARRPITLLAIGCVIFTTCLIAVVARYLIPGFSWSEGFVLGAIISPPDAVAATAATKGLGVPKRVVTILEGESLVNDATGLIAYRYAVAAVVTGMFSFWEAGAQFLVVAGGGIAVGVFIGWVFSWIHRITPDNPTTDTTLTFLTPFIAFLVAEEMHLSGVLAVVSAGLFLSRTSSEIFNHQMRLQATATWDTVIFMLNGIVFILIGLQLPTIMGSFSYASLPSILGYGAIVSAAVIVGRLVWVYPGTFLPRMLSKKIRTTEPRPSIRLATVVAWAGMRGVVSLAAALALPLTIADGTPFHNRELIIFLTFCVIFSTLLVQGFTLRPLIAWMKITPDEKEREEETEVRLRIASAIIEYIEENYAIGLRDEVLNQIKTKYEIRIQRVRKDLQDVRLNEALIREFHRIQQELIRQERKLVIQLRREGRISDETLRKIEYELDLEETRLLLDPHEPVSA